MKLARYRGGAVTIEQAPEPALPPGGLLVQTEACGLCSGELMDWYMDRKTDPVLGHEVAGVVIESDSERFPVGCRVFPHHHAPCMVCQACLRGAYVQCDTWRSTHLDPGGMAERFAVSAELLLDAHRADDLRAIDAALAEPLGCVVKSLRQAPSKGRRVAVIGLGNMGVLHMLVLGGGAIGYELRADRREHAANLGLDARDPESAAPGHADVVFVCPGSPAALELALRLVAPRGTVLLFAPFGGHEIPGLLDRLYFLDITLATSYSCGPDDTTEALRVLRSGTVRAEQIVSDFIPLADLPAAYQRMKGGEILKAMVVEW